MFAASAHGRFSLDIGKHMLLIRKLLIQSVDGMHKQKTTQSRKTLFHTKNTFTKWTVLPYNKLHTQFLN